MQAARSGEAVPPVLDSFEVEFLAGDSAAHRVELGEAWPVRFELAGFGAGVVVTPGQRRQLPGRPRTAATWGMSCGWNATI